MKKWDIKEKRRIIIGFSCFLLFGPLAIQAVDDISDEKISARKGFSMALSEQALELYHPFLLYEEEEQERGTPAEQMLRFIADSIPFHYFVQKEVEETCLAEVVDFAELQKELQGSSESTELEQQDLATAVLEENRKVEETMKIQTQIPQELQNTVTQPQEEQAVEVVAVSNGFVPEQQKKAVYVSTQLQSTEFVKKTFYTEDATTMIRPEQIDYDTLMSFDATLKQSAEAPQILIYHTHSQENYIDSNPQDAATTILGVGEHLAAILRTEYGFNVLHHMGQYDVDSRDDAYAKAAVGLEEVLEQNPSIEVVIDLHRDAVAEGNKLVTTVQGQDMAQFMFFNGLSYTRARGELTSLPNPYVQENLAFAFQMKLAADEYYPGLTRKTYLKGYRYNLQYRPKSLLIELGAQTNTVEEAMNACRPLAHVISMVLKGENKQE